MSALSTWARRALRYEKALLLLTTEWVDDQSPPGPPKCSPRKC